MLKETAQFVIMAIANHVIFITPDLVGLRAAVDELLVWLDPDLIVRPEGVDPVDPSERLRKVNEAIKTPAAKKINKAYKYINSLKVR